MSAIKRFFGNIFWRLHQGVDMKSTFENLYACRQQSAKTFEAINRKVFGDLYAGDLTDPCGFSTLEDLDALFQRSGLPEAEKSDKRLIDLACGRGGAGLWLAKKTGSTLEGYDLSEVAIEAAESRIAEYGMEGRAKFGAADIREIPAESSAFDVATCVDSLFIIPDKLAVLNEVRRVLKPGGIFECITWEVRRAFAVPDYRPLLKKANFSVEYYEEVPGWRDRQRGMHEELIARQDQLIEEMGKKAASVWLNCAKYELRHLDQMRRVFFVARRPL